MTYLIFESLAHSVIYFVQASSVNEALWQYVSGQNGRAVLGADGSIRHGDSHYSHPLAYIEANYKTQGEWQIRRLPKWVWQNSVVEAFCGESKDGFAWIIADCRVRFAEDFPRSRAKAFVWYLRQGTLVTFYRRQGPFRIKVLKRYLWQSDGTMMTDGQTKIEEWGGDYQQIMDSLLLEPLG